MIMDPANPRQEIPVEERLWQLVASFGPLTNKEIYERLVAAGYTLDYGRVACIAKRLVDSGRLDREKPGVFRLP